jgi:beta-glucosidase
MFALWDAMDGWVVEPGEVQFHVGASSADIRLQTAATLSGGEYLPGHARAFESRIAVADG